MQQFASAIVQSEPELNAAEASAAMLALRAATGDRQATKALLDRARASGHDQAKLKALRHLGTLSFEQSRSVLLAALDETQPGDVVSAARDGIRDAARAHSSEVLEVAEDESQPSYVRRTVLGAVELLGASARQLSARLANLTGAGDSEVRFAALQALAAVDAAAAAPRLVRALDAGLEADDEEFVLDWFRTHPYPKAASALVDALARQTTTRRRDLCSKALKAATGQDFGTDVRLWRAWLVSLDE